MFDAFSLQGIFLKKSIFARNENVREPDSSETSFNPDG